MNIFEYFKKHNIDTLSTAFYNKIVEWDSWYKGNVRNFHSYRMYHGQGESSRVRRHSLGIAKKLCEDMANLLLNERVTFSVGSLDETGTVTDAQSNATYDYLKKVLTENNWWVKGNEYQERKAATGTAAYLPYITNAVVGEDGEILSGTVKMNYVSAENIFPITWENGRVTECAFVFIRTWRRKSYAHIQLHLLQGEGEEKRYIIENHVVECTSGSGTEIPAGEWGVFPPFASLAPRIDTGSPERQFVIDTLNLVNNADTDVTNPMGVSIFANSIDVLRGIDLEYDSYVNEFLLGRKRILVAPEMLHLVDGSPVFDANDAVFYNLPDGYFDKTNEAIHEINMELRTEQHSRAINDSLNLLSLKCGFGPDHFYKFTTGEVKTATEVISEQSDLFRTIKKHELVLESVLKELFRIIIRLGIAAGNKELLPDPEIRIVFDDSIIEDKGSERQQDRQDVAMGVMSLAEYRAKWYGETEEAAAALLPEQTGVIP